MEMRAPHSRCGFLLALAHGPLASGFQSFVALTLVALLVAGTASPQSPGGVSAPATLPSAKTPEAPPPRPDKNRAQTAYQAGRRAEQSGDWKDAYTAYSEATVYGPTDKEYSLLREHSRFQLIQGLADLAERQLLSGDVTGARQQLLHALEIDPNYAIARERLEQLPADSPDLTQEKRPRLAGLPRLNTKPGTRDFDFRGATRSAYEEVGRQFGVTVAFDGDLPDRIVRFRAPNVDFETALMVLSRQTRTFTRVVDDHTLFVTEDSVQKERDYAVEIEKNIPLPASVTSDEMNETVRMIREMTGISRTQLNTATRTLTVRSTEANVALAQALVEQIEQPHGEMMLEIEILQVDRDAAHQLGIIPPESTTVFTLSPDQIFKLQQAGKSGTLLSVLASIFGSNSALGAAAGGLGTMLPPLIAFGGGKTIFLATVPGATANFSQTLSAVRSARRVLLRAQDGKPATFFVGDRYPISLAVLSNSLATSTTSALAAALVLGSLPHKDYATGIAPVSVATGVFTGDGHTDLVVANQRGGTPCGHISVFLGVGDGTFGNCTDVTAGTSLVPLIATPSAVAVGDFNHDGKADIAVTDSANNRVLILLGNGDGTFTAPAAYPTGTNPVALVVQDFDGDGEPDLAVVNQVAGTVSILLGKKTKMPDGTTHQDGTFTTKTDFAVGKAPVAIASGVFTTSGFQDLAVTNNSDSTVSILLGKGDGTFQTKTDYATGTSPQGIAVANFNSNNDAHEDLAVAHQADTAGNSLSILLGKGDGTFAKHTEFPAGSGPKGIVAAAFTTQGNLDLAVADQSSNDLSLLIGNGDGTFASPVTLPSGNGPVALAVADLTGNGSLDLISANEAANTVTVTLNTLQSSGSSSIPSSSSSPQTAYPSAEYVDLGLKVKATPRLHGDDEVTLHLEFDIRALSGSSVNGIPVLTNRTLDQTLRLRENQTSVLSGIVEASEARTIRGLPLAATAPGVGYLTGNHTADTKDTETLFIITPRALRLPPRNPRALYAGRGEPSTPPSPVAPLPGVPVLPGPPPGAQPISPGGPLQPPPPGGFQLPPPGRPQ
jgi:Flp pilus assembly secretin CpaC